MSADGPNGTKAGGPTAARPAPAAPGLVRRRFTRGTEKPRGVVWFGVRGFWGHARHFVASAIATEDVDSRDWMSPDEPRALVERVARLLGGVGTGTSVTERLGRDVWIDFVADTGDDVSVSRAVGRLMFAEYELPEPGNGGAFLRAPRGDVLFFGGDTAYPVATADEIRDRVITPFNEVLAERDDGRRRVLIGIPGNHDWYDGLDGFGRLFRRHVDYDVQGRARATLHGSSRTMLGHYAEFARELFRGGQVEKPHTLDLLGYTAVQGASYFVLPIAPGLPILGVDRQLRSVDTRQKLFFASFLNQNVAVSPWVVLPDPVYAYGAPSPTGVASVRALGLTLAARSHLVLSGDIHHYRREDEGPTLHVTAGGGGAFLHPAPFAREGVRPAHVQWPDAAQSSALLGQIPWKVALGRSGILPHLGFSLAFAPAVVASGSALGMAALGAAATVLAAFVLALIGGGFRRAGLLATLLAVLVAGACFGLGLGLERAAALLGLPAARPVIPLVQLALTGVVGAFLFGAYLALLTRLGRENSQAFTALDHPGYRHFVRFRVRADGSAVDGWCIGLVDPVRAGEEPVLVDSFTWKCR